MVEILIVQKDLIDYGKELNKMNKFILNCLISKLIIIYLLFLPSVVFSQDIQAISAIVNDEVISRYDVQQRVQLIVSTSGIKPTQENISRLEVQAHRTERRRLLRLRHGMILGRTRTFRHWGWQRSLTGYFMPHTSSTAPLFAMH